MKVSTYKFIKKFKCRLVSLFIKLTPVTEKDCRDIYDWRNDEINRKFSINPEIIPWETHQKWFEAKINSDKVIILIATYLKQKLGVIIFNFENTYPEISIYLIPGKHGKGFGLSLLFAATDWLKSKKLIKEIFARIIPQNYASISIFTQAGYKLVKQENNYELWSKMICE